MLNRLRSDMRRLGNREKATVLARFFKTGKGEYGEGDIFLGLKVPESREIAKKYSTLDRKGILTLLGSKIHEERLVALLMLVHNYKGADAAGKRKIYCFYLKNAERVNNWDLVDLTAPNIVGDHLLTKDRKVLYRLAKSKLLWERRIAIIATFTFIRNHEFKDTLKISEMLLDDEHDLMHKAVGWMLRELGKRDQPLLERFLRKHIRKLPRTTLRYAIERFPEKKRLTYLKM